MASAAGVALATGCGGDQGGELGDVRAGCDLDGEQVGVRREREHHPRLAVAVEVVGDAVGVGEGRHHVGPPYSSRDTPAPPRSAASISPRSHSA